MDNSIKTNVMPYKASVELEKGTRDTANALSILPNEVIVRIFSFIGITLLNCPQVCKEWKRLCSDSELWSRELWSVIFKTADLSHVKTSYSFMNDGWKYRDIALQFMKSNKTGAAIAACERCSQIDAFNGAYGFRDLFKAACGRKEYETALQCQQLAKKYEADAGNEAMCYFIKSQVDDPNFLESAEKLISHSKALINEDREFGLQALMKIADKFADLQKYEEAMECTQLARTLGDARDCPRGRNHSDDIHPFNQMSAHMLKLKQYKLAEECARKGESNCCHTDWLFSDIIKKQIEEENYANTTLLAAMTPSTMPGMTAYEAVVFHLIDQGRFDEAKNLAKIRLNINCAYNKSSFQINLERKLAGSGIDVNAWLS